VEKPTIGIKIADGSYFPILEEGSTKRKRLVLTTVNDDQESVQIDLYKGEGSELADASYVGSLLIENLTQGPKESSEIELKIGFDNDGTLNAEAGDLASGQIESLSVSMESLAESAMYDVPEFSLDDESEDFNIDDLDLDSEELSLDDEDLDFGDIPEDDESLMEDNPDDFMEEETGEIETFMGTEIAEEPEDDFTGNVFPGSEITESSEKKGGNPFLIALLVLIAIAAIAGISYLIFRSLQGENAPALEAKTETTEEPASEAPVKTPVVVVPEAQEAVAATVPAQESNKILDTSGVWYRIRWGDTLWGISYSFYDSPREYNQIVKENSITDPDIIFAETEIFIPSKK